MSPIPRIRIYLPSVTLGDRRPLRVLDAIESVLPDRLRYRFGKDASQELFPSLESSLVREILSGSAHVTNGHEEEMVSFLWRRERFEGHAPGVQADDFSMTLHGTSGHLAATEALLFAVSNVIDPFWGTVDAKGADDPLEGQFGSEADAGKATPYGLPLLHRRDYMGRWRYTATLPSHVSWLNVWSRATLEEIGYREEDASLFDRVQPLRSGGLLLRLTRDPLDPVLHHEHVEALFRIYRRFEAIGGRNPRLSSLKARARAAAPVALRR